MTKFDTHHILHCKKVFADFAADDTIRHWIRYVRGKKRRPSRGAKEILDIAAMMRKHEIDETCRIDGIPDDDPPTIVNRIYDLAAYATQLELSDSWKPRGIVIIAYNPKEHRMFVTASMCRDNDLHNWNKHYGRYLCVDKILRAINNKPGGAMEIDLDVTRATGCASKAWIMSLPVSARETATNLYDDVMTKVLGLLSEDPT